jgi:hypothetical protein
MRIKLHVFRILPHPRDIITILFEGFSARLKHR